MAQPMTAFSSVIAISVFWMFRLGVALTLLALDVLFVRSRACLL